MQIGIIGAGNIGGTLGAHWARAGHDILFAVRRPEAIAALIESLGSRTRTGTVAEAAAFGPVLLFAAPYGFWPEFAQGQAEALAGKLVIDAANPYPQRDGAVAEEASAVGAGAYTQRLLPRSHVVRAFNTIFWKDLRDEAGRASPRLAIPLVGDNPAALNIARRLIADAGFDAVDAGGLATSRRVDPGAPVYAKSLNAADLTAALAADGSQP